MLLAALTRLRQLCCHPRLVYPRTQAGSSKAAYLLQLLTDLREDGHKVLVFSQFRSFLELLAPRLRQHGFRALLLDGTTPAETREQRIAAFQAGEADVFLISLKAGGFGLNLTAADTVIHLDPVVEPRGRGPGDGARAPHRPAAAGDRGAPGRARHDRGGGAGPARRQARAGRRPARGRRAGRDAGHRRVAGADPQRAAAAAG